MWCHVVRTRSHRDKRFRGVGDSNSALSRCTVHNISKHISGIPKVRLFNTFQITKVYFDRRFRR
jgi:hypothetical protein